MKRRRFIASIIAGAAGLLMPKAVAKAAVTPKPVSIRMQAFLDYNQDYIKVLSRTSGTDGIALFNHCQPTNSAAPLWGITTWGKPSLPRVFAQRIMRRRRAA